MKIRMGFVSNSSSSSFVCCICGEEQSGMDISFSDCEMYNCENGHIICESHIKKSDQKEIDDLLESKSETDEDFQYEFRDNLPAKYCPVCQMLNLIDEDELKYYRKKLSVTKKITHEEVKSKFKDYDEFKGYIE